MLLKKSKIIKTVLEQKQISVNELTGSARQHALKDFRSGSDWYRSEAVDRLSEAEAGIIAARLVRRVQAKTTLTGDKAEGLQRSIADALIKRFTDDKTKQDQNALLKSKDGLQQAAGPFLDKDQIPILKDAIAIGLRPLPNEK